jgi:hypothetical protein
VDIDGVTAACLSASCIEVSANGKGKNYRLKERKKFMKFKDKIINTLFDDGKSSND